MNLIKPEKLKIGDTIGIIAPSGEVDFNKILQSVEYFEQKGFKVKLGSHIKCNLSGYLAGSDEQRLEDLHNAFSDDEIKMILCARGGYGALRLVEKINYSIIKNHPKIFCGYSDVTVLNSVFYKKCGLVSFSAPMAQGDFSSEIDTFTEKHFFETLQTGRFSIKSNSSERTFVPVEGVLFGGNLATLASLCGTDFIPDEKFILFAEDIGEPAYKLDRYFTQLFNIEKFRENISAVVCGEFTGVDSLSDFDNFLSEIETKYNLPVVKGFPFGHGKTKATIPCGAFAKLISDGLFAENFLLDD